MSQIFTLGLVLAGGGLALWYFNKSIRKKAIEEPPTEPKKEISEFEEVQFFLIFKNSFEEKIKDSIEKERDMILENTRFETIESPIDYNRYFDENTPFNLLNTDRQVI